MKNVMCLMLCLLLVLTLAEPAFAAVDDFVPGVGEKESPVITEAEQDGKDVKDCLVVTSVREAKEKTTDITQEERDELVEVYEKLLNDTMELPLEGDYLIWDLVDLSYQKTSCRDKMHGHREWLEQENTAVTATFDLGIAKAAGVTVLTYIDEKWEPVKEVTNNDDGTVTCVFDDICPVVFCLPSGSRGSSAAHTAPMDDFVPSISYKDGPDIEEAEQDDEDVGDCLIVTSIKEAIEKTTDITQEERDLLLEVYDKLLDGSMKLPLEDEYVIRELVDVSYRKTTCRDKDHGHKEWLEQDNTTVTVTFDLGINRDVDVDVLTYIDGKWTPIKEVTNNGDGTITCVFDDICPVAFCLSPKDQNDTPPPKTGDQVGTWVAVMAVSLAVLAALVLLRRKGKR